MPERWIRPSAAHTRTWRQPARERALHGTFATPHGEFSLYRAPGARLTAAAEAGQWEEWQFTLGGQVVLRIDDATRPWEMRSRVREGIHGRLDGAAFGATARRRSFKPSLRGIHFAMEDGRTLSFEVRRRRDCLIRGGAGHRQEVSRRRGPRWETSLLDRGETALVCFVAVAGLTALLDSPLWELTP